MVGAAGKSVTGYVFEYGTGDSGRKLSTFKNIVVEIRVKFAVGSNFGMYKTVNFVVCVDNGVEGQLGSEVLIGGMRCMGVLNEAIYRHIVG